MKNVIFTKAEIAEIKNRAEAEIKAECGKQWDVIRITNRRNKLYNELLRQKTRDASLLLALNGGDLMYGYTVATIPKIKRIVQSDQGFAPDEYEKLTGQQLPFCDANTLFVEKEGKVYGCPENGNISISMGAPDFSLKRGVLVTSLTTNSDVTLQIV